LKVGFIFLHPFASSLGSTVRIRELTAHLSKFNVESFILTPYEKNQILSKGVEVVSVAGLLQKYGLSKYFYNLSKFLYYNSFFIKYFLTSKIVQSRFAKSNASSIVKALKRHHVKILQVEQDFALAIGIEVKKRTGLPLIADLHNITSEELVATGAIKPNGKEYRKLQDMLKNNLAEADAVVVVSDLMKEYVVKNYATPTNVVYVVPPGAEPREITRNASDHPKVVYSGLVTFREHVNLFVESMPIIKERIKDVEFFITDKGEDIKKIKKLSRQLKVNPIFFWYPTTENFKSFLFSCDVAVLPSSGDLARRMGTPVKLFEYLSAGLPVVANNVGSWTNIIRKSNVGLLTPDNPTDFAEAVSSLLENQLLRKQLSFNALKAIKYKYNWDLSAKALVDLYENFN
jgi:glycosyltransferase involved in cell wall biosynthesis